MPRIVLPKPKKGWPKWFGGPEGAMDLINPIAIAKKALFNIAAKGLPKRAQQTMAKEFAATPQRTFDLVKSASVSPVVPGRAAVSLSTSRMGYNADIAKRSQPGLTSHELGHLILEKLKPSTKMGIITEFREMLPKHRSLLERVTRTRLDKPHELGAEAYRQATLKKMDEHNVLNLFPSYSQRLARRLKRWGQ